MICIWLKIRDLLIVLLEIIWESWEDSIVVLIHGVSPNFETFMLKFVPYSSKPCHNMDLSLGNLVISATHSWKKNGGPKNGRLADDLPFLSGSSVGFTGVPTCWLFQTLTKAFCEQPRGSQRLTILSIGVYRRSGTLATPLWIHTAWLRQGSTNTVSRLLLLMHAASTLTRTILTTCKCHIGDVRPGTWPESLGAEVSKVWCFECDERHTSRDTGYYNLEVWSRVICWNGHLLRSQEI